MKNKLVIAALAIGLCLVSFAACAETVILSTAVPASSSAYSLDGCERAYVQIEAVTGTATATVILKHRAGATSCWTELKTIANPADVDVAYCVEPYGDVMVTVSAASAGTVRATLNAYLPDGKGKW